MRVFGFVVAVVVGVCAFPSLNQEVALSISSEAMNKAPMEELMNVEPKIEGEQLVQSAPASDANNNVIVVGVGNTKREFRKLTNSNCKNRAHIMSTYLHKTSIADCQSKCANDEGCTGFSTEVTSGKEGECTVFKAECELGTDQSHDLYVLVDESGAPKVASSKETKPDVALIAKDDQKPSPPSVNATSTTVENEESVINVTIVVPTIRRFQSNGEPAPERYLSPMVQKIWQDLTPAQQKNVHFLVLNSDKEPSKHTEALSLASHPGVTLLSKPSWDQQVDDELVRQGAVRENGEVFLEDGRQVSKEWIHWVAAEDMDGSYLLELGAQRSPYVLFLEDDVWPTTNAISKLTKMVKSMEDKEWLFLDLYTPNLDWAEGMLTVKNNEAYNFQCCTQSMLFKTQNLPGIINWWRSHPAEPVDDNLRNYRKKMTPEKQIYAARPNLFEHVGAYSSNPQKSTGVVEHTSLDFVPLLVQLEEKTTA